MVLVGSGKPGLVPLIVVTMREPTRDQEEQDAVALFTWGSALYEEPSDRAAGDVVRAADRQRRTIRSPPSPASGLTAVVRKAATVSAVIACERAASR